MPQITGNVKSVNETVNGRTKGRTSRQKTGYRTPNQSPTIKEIKEKVDIVALINGRVNLKKAGKDFKGLCPFHEEKSPSFTVSPSKQIYCCFGCNRSGDAITFLEEYDKLSKKDAIEYLARQVGLVSGFSSSIENQKPKTKAKTKPTQPEQPEQSEQPEQPEQPEQSQQSQEVTQQAKKEQAKKETRSLVTSDFDDFPIREKADQNSWKVKQLREENEIKGDVYQIIYPYSDTQRIIRYEWMSEGKEKADKYFQYSCVNPENNQWAYKKGVGIWAYKLDEVVRLSSNPSSQIILHLEGEKSVEIARQNGISAFSLRGSDKDKKTALSLLPKDSAIVFLLDNDTSGKKQGENLANICNEIGLEFYAIEVGEVCPDLKDTPKADIEEILGLISRDEFIEKVESLVKEKSLIPPITEEVKSTEIPQKTKPKSSDIFDEIVSEVQDFLIYNDETKFWMRYEAEKTGVWSKESNEYIESIIFNFLEKKGLKIKYSFISNTIKLLRCKLIVRKWPEKPTNEFLPFENGVLNLATKELIPHSQTHFLTWALPRKYNIFDKDFPKINAFLDEVTGNNSELKNILICFCNAVLKGRADLNKFMYLTGPGGTGKSVYIQLMTELVGGDNCHSSDLEVWCNNNFESANAYNKRLVVFPDEDKKIGKFGNFKKLTGRDVLRCENKGEKSFPFVYRGMVVVASNFPVFQGDSSSGFTRRIISVPFTVIPKKRDTQLMKKLELELSAFTNYVLSLSDELVTSTLAEANQIGAINKQFWDDRKRTDSIAAWFNEYVILEASAETQIGSDKNEWKAGTPKTLYGSYNEFCENSGFSAKGLNNFSPDFLELVNITLNLKDIQKTKNQKGNMVITGVRLREKFESSPPTYEEILGEKVAPKTSPETSRRLTGDLTEAKPETLPEAETLATEGTGGYGDLAAKLPTKKISDTQTPPLTKNISDEEKDLIRQGLLAAKNQDDFDLLREKYPEKIDWVYKNCLDKAEKDLIKQTCKENREKVEIIETLTNLGVGQADDFHRLVEKYSLERIEPILKYYLGLKLEDFLTGLNS
ncbi:MAG: phage/plasmid primase, P4 family [Microcoleaceae cyanobacterium]